MALTSPLLLKATPGDPITSEAWNNLVDSIEQLYREHNRTQATLTIAVREGNGKEVVSSARVTLVGNKVASRLALYLGADVRRYIVSDLPAGNYRVVVEAPGFDNEERKLVIAEGSAPQSLDIALTRTEVQARVPMVFGDNLLAAEKKLKKAGFVVVRVIDSQGREITADDKVAIGAKAKVLNQVPEADVLYAVGGSVALSVSARPVVEERVSVPVLLGLSLNQAKEVLQANNLVLGDIETVEEKSKINREE